MLRIMQPTYRVYLFWVITSAVRNSVSHNTGLMFRLWWTLTFAPQGYDAVSSVQHTASRKVLKRHWSTALSATAPLSTADTTQHRHPSKPISIPLRQIRHSILLNFSPLLVLISGPTARSAATVLSPLENNRLSYVVCSTLDSWTSFQFSLDHIQDRTLSV